MITTSNPNVGGIKLTGYIPTQNKKDALKVVAIAVGAIVKEGRDGKIYFYQATEELISNQIIAEDTVYTGWPHAGMLMAGPRRRCRRRSLRCRMYLRQIATTRLGDIDSKDICSYTKVSVNYFNYGLRIRPPNCRSCLAAR